MTKLSEHFNLNEFTKSQTAVRLGISNTPTPEIEANLKYVAGKLEHIRTTLGDYSISISSGYRCPALNKAVGGSPTSSHQTGYAVDFECDQYGTPRKIAEKINAAGYKYDQLILEGVNDEYPDGAWVHISFDPMMRQELLTMKRKNGRTIYEKGLT